MDGKGYGRSQGGVDPSRRRAMQLVVAPILSAIAPTTSRASIYPNEPITVVIPLPPGGSLDVLARFCSERFRKDLNYPFIVENIPGATTNIGAAQVAHAAPDGSTALLTISSTIVTNIFMFKHLPFDPDKDFSPVLITTNAPLALVVHHSLPVHTLQEYIAYAKAHPGDVAIGNSGIGSAHYLCAEYLAMLAGIKLNNIPYKGSPEATADVIAGHIASAIVAIGLVTEQAKAGVVRILAVTDDQRTPTAPDVPTVGEIVPGFVHAPSGWNAMFVPAKTPKNVVDTLNKEMNVALEDPNLVAKLRNLSLLPVGGPPEAVNVKVQHEREVTRIVSQKIGLKPQ